MSRVMKRNSRRTLPIGTLLGRGPLILLDPSPVVADPEQATADARTDTYGFAVPMLFAVGMI